MLKAGGKYRARIEDPAKRLLQATGLPSCVEAGGQPVDEHGSIHVVLDVFLARPHDLDRTVDLLGDLDGSDDAVGLEPPAEAAAD